MALTNAERQRRFMTRLKTKASSVPDPRVPLEPWPTIRLARVDPEWATEKLKMLLVDWEEIEAEAEEVLDRLTSPAFGSKIERRLSVLRQAIHLMECAGPQFLLAAKRYLTSMEAELSEKRPTRRTKRGSTE